MTITDLLQGIISGYSLSALAVVVVGIVWTRIAERIRREAAEREALRNKEIYLMMAKLNSNYDLIKYTAQILHDEFKLNGELETLLQQSALTDKAYDDYLHKIAAREFSRR